MDNVDLTAEVRRSLGNLEAVCRAAGMSLDRGLRMGVFTTRLEAFAEISAAYAEHFEGRPVPARTTIGVAALRRCRWAPWWRSTPSSRWPDWH